MLVHNNSGAEHQAPHWLLPAPKFWKTAKEIHEDNRGNLFILLDAAMRSEDNSLLGLLWSHVDPIVIPTSWLRNRSGLSMREVEEIGKSSELVARYRCLDCESLLKTHDREHHVRRRTALTKFLAVEPGSFVATEQACELLCDVCKQRHLCARQTRIEELCTMAYRAYLDTPEWHMRRQQKREAANYNCQGCEWQGLPLEVHHRCYDRRGDELMQDLTVYCRTCHEKQHGLLSEAG